MMRISLGLVLLYSIGSLSTHSELWGKETSVIATSENTRPNIIFILADDMRFDFYSAAGHPYLQTPNLDRLAREGTVFTRAYVTTPLCGPNRSSINTGLIAPQHGMLNHDSQSWGKTPYYPLGNFLPATIHETVGQTAMIGKWFHNPNAPQREEYDRWFVHSGNDGDQYHARRFSIQSEDHSAVEAAEIANAMTSYSTDIEFAEAARWAVENRESQTFQFISPFAPHAPNRPAHRHDGIYDGQTMPVRANVDVAGEQLREITINYNKRCEMMLALDEGIGHLLQQLEMADLLEDSIIVFSSDNGTLFGEHGRLGKRVPYEEACRIPLIVRYGSNLAGQGPIDPDQLISHADLMMTFVELVGGDTPGPAPGTKYYGRSLASQWLGSSGFDDVARRDDIITVYYHNERDDNRDNLDNDGLVWASIVTDDNWKYTAVNLEIGDDVDIEKHQQITDGLVNRLINLNTDPFETSNLIQDPLFSQIAQDLRRRLFEQLVEYDVEFKFASGNATEANSGIERDYEFARVDIAGSAIDDEVEINELNDGRVSVSIFGEIAENEIFQTETVDRILFRGFSGNDRFINRSPIDSTAFGHSGDDILIGGNGHNRFQGGSGDDLLMGGDRNDLLRGRTGNDIILGGRQQDRLFGDEGNDILFGHQGRDRIDGGSGDDHLFGGEQFDRLLGGIGNDMLFGGLIDKDRLDSGPGFDRLYTTLNVGNRDNDQDDAWIQLGNPSNQVDGGDWTDKHVEQIDNALRMIAEKTGGRTVLIRDSDLNSPIRLIKANQLQRSNRLVSGIRTLSLSNWDPESDAETEVAISKIIRQIARSWDTVEEIELAIPEASQNLVSFLQESQWQMGDNPPSGFLLSSDGRWHYHELSEFFGSSGNNNPSADWASIWDLVVNPASDKESLARLADKVQHVQSFFAFAEMQSMGIGDN